MKAAVLQGTGTLAVDEVAAPTLEPGEMILRVCDCGICGSDLHAVHSMPPGTIFGHEFAGEVMAVGHGAGPIGIAALVWARELGAKTVVSDLSPGRREMAERLGATAVVDPRKDEPGFVALDLGGESLTTIFECVGAPGLIQTAIAM